MSQRKRGESLARRDSHDCDGRILRDRHSVRSWLRTAALGAEYVGGENTVLLVICVLLLGYLLYALLQPEKF